MFSVVASCTLDGEKEDAARLFFVGFRGGIREATLKGGRFANGVGFVEFTESL